MIFNLKFEILILWIASFNLSAQISQPSRYERGHKSSDEEFVVLSLKEKGIALVRGTKEFENNKKVWEVIFIDTAMVETWTAKVEVEHRMNILGHDYRDGNVYLIFQESEGTVSWVNICEIIPAHKSVKQHLFKPEINIHFTHFSVLQSTAIFGGYINKEPTLLMYHLSDEKARIIPGVLQPNVQLIDLRMNSNETFNALFIEKSGRIKKLLVRTFDAKGVLIVEDVITIEEGKNILEAITSTLVRDEMLVVGTWTYGTANVAAGIFSVVVDPFQDQKVNYYDFAMLNHFLDGLKPKRAAKIKAKAEWRKSVGKPVEYRMNVLPVRIEETKSGFSFLGEAYEISSGSSRNSGYYSPYSPYGYSPYGYSPYGYPFGLSSRYRYPYSYNPYNSPYASGTPFNYANEVKMKDAALLFFDSKGNMLSDLSLHFPQIRLTTKDQVSDFITVNGTTTMACKAVKEIIVKVADQENVQAKEEKIMPELKYPEEVIRSEEGDNTSIRTWYGRYFFVYGYQTVRNLSTKNSRDVFYINKIKVD